MKYVLVICRTTNYRSLWVDNLVVRGYLAVGVASLTEAERLIAAVRPKIVVLCQTSRIDERLIDKLEDSTALADVPRLLVSPEKPTPGWLTRHALNGHLSSDQDIAWLAHRVIGRLQAG